MDLQRIVEDLGASLGLDTLTIYQYVSSTQSLMLRASSGLNSVSIGTQIPLSRGIVGLVARNKQPISVLQPQNHPSYWHVEGSGEEKFATFLGIPILQFDDLLGVLVTQSIAKRRYHIPEIEALYATAKSVIGYLVADPV